MTLIPVYLLGRLIGTCDSIESTDEKADLFCIGFVPGKGVALPEGEVSFDFALGTATVWDANCNPLEEHDMVMLLAGLPRSDMPSIPK